MVERLIMRFQESKTYLGDLDISISHTIEIEKLKNKSILITGASGTIGSYVADMLLRYNQIENAKINLCLGGRNVERLKEQFLPWKDERLSFVQYNNISGIAFDFEVDYIIHAAGNAHPVAFNGDPVGTIMGNVEGTYKLLEYGRTHSAKRLLYVSSGEVYGQGDSVLDEFEENYAGYIDTTSPRSCYPLSKRTSENLCVSYSKQYGFETVVVRPCHTYGPGITSTDSRANAQFMRNVLNNEDIVMKSDGKQLRSYNYVGDCASAMLTVLLNGESGHAYNTANPYVKITIAQLAEIIANMANRKVVFANPSTIDLDNRTPIVKQVLSSKKLEALGWKSAFSVETGVKHTLDILQGK